MTPFKKRFPRPQQSDTDPTAHQRRIAKIVHDDRGLASVEWHEAPQNYERPVFEVKDPPAITRNSKVRGGLELLHIKNDETFNPYDHQLDGNKEKGGKRDLRKLSEHIKMMRELEERKKRGEPD